MLQARQIMEKRKAMPQKGMSLKDLINQRMKEAQSDSLNKSKSSLPKVSTDSVNTTKPSNEVNTDNYTFDEAPKPLNNNQTKKPDNLSTDNYSFEDAPPSKTQNRDSIKTALKKNINTNDYVFEDEQVKKTNPDNFLGRYLKANATERVTGPFPYQPKFS